MRAGALTLAAAALVGGCQKKTPTAPPAVCTAVAKAALTLHIQNAAAGAMAVAKSGTYADTARVPATAGDTASVSLAYNHAGVFSVLVRRQGYRDWTRDSVTVEAEQLCNLPVTVNLSITLQPAP